VRDSGDLSEPFAKAAVDRSLHLVSEPRDGEPPRIEAHASEFTLNRSNGALWETEWNSAEIPLGIAATNSRVVFVDTSALAPDTTGPAENPLPPSRPVLVGQIRYEWLVSVGYLHAVGPGGRESIILTYHDSAGTQWNLTLTLADADSAVLAERILRRCGTYRLAMTDDKPEPVRARIAELARCQAVEPADPRVVTTYAFPTFYNAPRGGESYRPPEDAEPAPAQAASPRKGPVRTVIGAPASFAAPAPTDDSDGALAPNAPSQPEDTPAPRACPACGAPVPDGYAFCSTCGAPVSVAAPPASSSPAPPSRCDTCGAPVTEGNAFCVMCGTPVP
jgi:hypothetical protein